MDKTRKAVILAGGKGTRLKPFTYVLPKPLVPVGERPILAIVLEQLHQAGFREIVFCVNHMAELLMAYFGDGRKLGLHIEYAREEKPLGTVAPLRRIPNLPEHFLVMNGDLLTDLDFRALYDAHVQGRHLISVGVTQRKVNIDFGVMETAGDKLTGFCEKPEHNFLVSMGVYVFSKRVLDFVPADRAFGFDDLMHALLAAQQPVNVYPHSGYWLDIGRVEDFEKANADIQHLEFCAK